MAITYPGEYHDADSNTPVPKNARTLALIEKGRPLIIGWRSEQLAWAGVK